MCKADGLHVTMYKDAKCETESLSAKIEWGKCTANPEGKGSIKLTNAVALKSAAVAMVAFVASQF